MKSYVSTRLLSSLTDSVYFFAPPLAVLQAPAYLICFTLIHSLVFEQMCFSLRVQGAFLRQETSLLSTRSGELNTSMAKLR